MGRTIEIPYNIYEFRDNRITFTRDKIRPDRQTDQIYKHFTTFLKSVKMQKLF